MDKVKPTPWGRQGALDIGWASTLAPSQRAQQEHWRDFLFFN